MIDRCTRSRGVALARGTFLAPGMTSPAWGRMAHASAGISAPRGPAQVRRTESAGVLRAERLRERRSCDGWIHDVGGYNRAKIEEPVAKG